MSDLQQIWQLFQEVPKKRPLVHMIPNSVSASLCADALAAVGARPLMALCPDEMEEIVSYAEALVVNMGQPTDEKQRAAFLALLAAGKRGLLAVLDPVGAGASSYRRKNMEELMAIPWKGIVKGNEAEVHTLLKGQITHEGIDSVQRHPKLFSKHAGSEYTFSEHAGLHAEAKRKTAVPVCQDRVYTVTGPKDRICVRKEGPKSEELLLLEEIAHPDQLAYAVVGTGCMTGALMGAFHAVVREWDIPVKEQSRLAAKAALLAVGFVQRQAAHETGYGAYRQRLLDELSCLLEQQDAFAVYVGAVCEEKGEC